MRSGFAENDHIFKHPLSRPMKSSKIEINFCNNTKRFPRYTAGFRSKTEVPPSPNRNVTFDMILNKINHVVGAYCLYPPYMLVNDTKTSVQVAKRSIIHYGHEMANCF